MPGFDDRLTRELERAARPAAPDVGTTFEDVTRRRAHRTVVRKVQVVTVVVVLLAGTFGAFALLDDRFEGSQPLAPVDPGGTMTFTWVDRGSVIAGVWATAGDGSNTRPLFPPSLPDGTWVQSVVASPDGGRIAYVASQTDAEGPEGVVVANADGTEPRVVSTESSWGGWSDLAWSPDGTTIAALAQVAPRTHVALIAADGSGSQRLDATAGANALAWAPDGRSIYAVTVEGSRSTIHVVPLSGDDLGRALPVGGAVKAVTVSPTDGTIAYVADVVAPTFGSPGDVWLLDPATGETTRLTTDGVATDIAWSPDGSRIALSVDGCAVMTMNPDGDDAGAMVFRDAAGGCPVDVSWGPGLPTTFSPTPLLEPAAEPSDAEMLQWRPVMGVGQVGSLTCPPDECTPELLSSGTVVLAGREELVGDTDVAFALGNVIADGTDVATAELLPYPTHPDLPYSVVLTLDEDAADRFSRANARASELEPPEGQLAVVWGGEVLSGPTFAQPVPPTALQLSFATQAEAQALIDAVTSGEETPTSPPPTGPEGQDVGLGTRLCDVSRLRGLDLVGDGTPTTAWTGFSVDAQGRCPVQADYLVAVDVTGDADADLQWGPIEPCRSTGCAPLGGTDLDGDGDEELVVHTNFSIVDHLYFSLQRLEDGGFTLLPILVAAPGNPAAGIEPGEPLMTSAAGDEGYASWMRCEGPPEAPVLVWTWTHHPVDSPQPAEWHETKLRLEDDEMFHVVATNDFELAADQDPGLIRSDEPACGLRFNLWPTPG